MCQNILQDSMSVFIIRTFFISDIFNQTFFLEFFYSNFVPRLPSTNFDKIQLLSDKN